MKRVICKRLISNAHAVPRSLVNKEREATTGTRNEARTAPSKYARKCVRKHFRASHMCVFIWYACRTLRQCLRQYVGEKKHAWVSLSIVEY